MAVYEARLGVWIESFTARGAKHWTHLDHLASRAPEAAFHNTLLEEVRR